MYGGPVGDNVMPYSMLGVFQRKRGGDQLGPPVQKLGKLIRGCLGDTADASRDFLEDPVDDLELVGLDDPSALEVDQETFGL